MGILQCIEVLQTGILQVYKVLFMGILHYNEVLQMGILQFNKVLFMGIPQRKFCTWGILQCKAALAHRLVLACESGA